MLETSCSDLIYNEEGVYWYNIWYNYIYLTTQILLFKSFFLMDSFFDAHPKCEVPFLN